MTLKIEAIFGEGKARIRLSGQFRSEYVGRLKDEMERHGSEVALDLEEVELADLDAIRFLNQCEASGLSILHCSPYISEWMLQEKNRPTDHPNFE